MDLAKYCVNAVLVEGRSVRGVAAATGRSKSWVRLTAKRKRPGLWCAFTKPDTVRRYAEAGADLEQDLG
jgi:transposase